MINTIGIFGISGSGKTHAILQLLPMYFESWGGNVFVLDCGGSYRQLCKRHQGQYIKGEGNILDPLASLIVWDVESIPRDKRTESVGNILYQTAKLIEDWNMRHPLFVLDEIYFIQPPTEALNKIYDAINKTDGAVICVGQTREDFPQIALDNSARIFDTATSSLDEIMSACVVSNRPRSSD
jgi:TraG P-loop domain